LDIDMDELSARRIEFSQGLDKILTKRPELQEQIRKLEAIYDDQLDLTNDEPTDTDTDSETESSDLRDWFDKQGFKFNS